METCREEKVREETLHVQGDAVERVHAVPVGVLQEALHGLHVEGAAGARRVRRGGQPAARVRLLRPQARLRLLLHVPAARQQPGHRDPQRGHPAPQAPLGPPAAALVLRARSPPRRALAVAAAALLCIRRPRYAPVRRHLVSADGTSRGTHPCTEYNSVRPPLAGSTNAQQSCIWEEKWVAKWEQSPRLAASRKRLRPRELLVLGGLTECFIIPPSVPCREQFENSLYITICSGMGSVSVMTRNYKVANQYVVFR